MTKVARPVDGWSNGWSLYYLKDSPIIDALSEYGVMAFFTAYFSLQRGLYA